MHVVFWFIIFLLSLLILLCAAVFIRAGFLLLKRPVLRLYQARAAEEDFCPVRSVPLLLLHFMLQIEDDVFFEHPGVAIIGIREAIQINLMAGKIMTGGSTISQQLVKNLYFQFHHSYFRKATEFLLTLYAERKLGKEKILEFYINIVYFGNGIYGFTHAARFYFGKNIEDPTVNQMFMMACMLYAPTVGNPIQHPDVFERIRNKRLNFLTNRKQVLISGADAEMIRSFHADCLDPELRAGDAFTENYPTDVRLQNDRFGPYPDKNRVKIP